MKKTAFTLAEVLITLTIIGVIAALTIPNLIQSYRKHQVEAGVKEAYTILDNAIKMGVAQNGLVSDAINANGTAFSYVGREWTDTYLVPYLKVVKQNDMSITWSSLYSKAPKNLKGTTIASGSSYWRQLILANGMLIGVASAAGYFRIQFFVDIDGPNKGPNTVGHDIFVFSYFLPYTNSQGTVLNTGDKLNAGDQSYEGYIYSNQAWARCTDTGYNCANDIQRNGWKIPDNYPVKKF